MNYKELIVWQKAHKLALKIFKLIDSTQRSTPVKLLQNNYYEPLHRLELILLKDMEDMKARSIFTFFKYRMVRPTKQKIGYTF